MNVTIVDYNSGNISSVINSFKEVAKEKANIKVTSDLKNIKSSDKLVLPGQGSFKSCVNALKRIDGLFDTLNEYGVNSQTGRAYSAILNDSDIASFRNNYTSIEDTYQDPSAYGAPRSIKIGLEWSYWYDFIIYLVKLYYFFSKYI